MAGVAGLGSPCSQSPRWTRYTVGSTKSTKPRAEMVVSVARSGPAELAGLRPGDILLSLDGHSVGGARPRVAGVPGTGACRPSD